MEIKLLAVDMDETAVNSSHVVEDRTIEALKRAAKKGIYIVPATGRCLEGLPGKIREMEEISYIISSNGAKAYDWKNQQVLYRKLIPYEAACEILKLCEKYKMGMAIHQEGKCYDSSMLQAIYRYTVYHRDFKAHRAIKELAAWVKTHGKPLEKIQAFSRDRELLEQLQEELKGFSMVETAISTSGYMEINHKDAQKGKALECLCAHLGVPMEAVMAIGDNANDYSMLETVGFPVAMGNAREEIQSLASYVTATNDQAGVAAAVEKYLL